MAYPYSTRRICGQRKKVAPKKDGQTQAPQTSQENAVATTTAKVGISYPGVLLTVGRL
jgi:hypothetical protein